MADIHPNLVALRRAADLALGGVVLVFKAPGCSGDDVDDLGRVPAAAGRHRDLIRRFDSGVQ